MTTAQTRPAWVISGLGLVGLTCVGILFFDSRNRISVHQVARELIAAHPRFTANGRVVCLNGDVRGIGEAVTRCNFAAVAMTSRWIFATKRTSFGGVGLTSSLQLDQNAGSTNLWRVSRRMGVNQWTFGWEVAQIAAGSP